METTLDTSNHEVEAIDDNEELEYTEDAFNVLGFSAQVEKSAVLRQWYHLALHHPGEV